MPRLVSVMRVSFCLYSSASSSSCHQLVCDCGNSWSYSHVFLSCTNLLYKYSKTCLLRPLKKKDKTKILVTNGSLMKVKFRGGGGGGGGGAEKKDQKL